MGKSERQRGRRQRHRFASLEGTAAASGLVMGGQDERVLPNPLSGCLGSTVEAGTAGSSGGGRTSMEGETGAEVGAGAVVCTPSLAREGCPDGTDVEGGCGISDFVVTATDERLRCIQLCKSEEASTSSVQERLRCNQLCKSEGPGVGIHRAAARQYGADVG